MRRGPFNFRALLALALLCLKVGNASRDYQLVVNFQNTTSQAETVAVSCATVWFNAFQGTWFNCKFLEPGEKAAVRRLEGEKRSSGLGVQDVVGVPKIRGRIVERNLQVASCPGSCSSSGSTKCRSIGCAFCSRCGRERHLQITNETRITTTAALEVERYFNMCLKALCFNARGCLIYTKIFRILNNGTSYPLTGTAIAV